MIQRFSLALLLLLAATRVSAGDDRLRAAQEVLKFQGYYFAEVNGEADDESTQALKRFQIRNLLPVTGELDEATARILDAMAAARPASAPDPAHPERTSPRIVGAPKPPLPSGSGSRESGPTPRVPTAALATSSAPTTTVAAGNPPPRPPTNAALETGTAPAGASAVRMMPAASPTGAVGAPVDESPPSPPRAPTSDRASAVSRAKEILRQEGFYRGAINGQRDSALYSALRQFQRSRNLNPTGQLDQPTLDALGMDRSVFAPPPPIARQSSRGPRFPRIRVWPW